MNVRLFGREGAAVQVNDGYVTNYGPGRVYFRDEDPVTVADNDGLIEVNARASLEGTQFLVSDVDGTVVQILEAAPTVPIPSGTKGDRGDPGPQGPAGPQGPGGADAVASSDAVRGAADRFYRLVAGALRFNGSGWDLVNDSFSRPQNVESVTTTSKKVDVGYAGIGALHVGSFVATPNEDLLAVGIRPIVKPGLTKTEIQLRQDRRFEDFAHWTGSAWVLEKGAASPFTLTGLNGPSADFPATVAADTPVAYYRFSDASGATITDSSGNGRNGAVVSTGTTYSATGGLATDGADKAMTVATGGTNEFTFALMAAMTQAAFSVEWFGKLPTTATVVFRDAQVVTNAGYYIAKDGSSPAKVYYRLGAATLYTTSMNWSALADNNWHHVVLTKNGANASLYVDGALIHSTTTGSSTALTSPWHVGRAGHNGGTAASEAVSMSELAFYAAELTATDVREHYYAATATGRLHVAHEDAGSSSPAGIALTPTGATARPTVGSTVTSTGFDIEFYDSAGALMLGASTGMKVGIVRDVAERLIDMTSFQAKVTVTGDDFPAVVLDDGPVGYWRLGETAGAATVNDEIGTADGTVVSGTTLGATGLLATSANTAASFDGAQGKITFPSPGFVTGVPFTIEFWFKPTGVGSVGSTTYGAPIGWSNATQPSRRILYNNSTGGFLIQAGGADLTAPAGTAPLNGTYHAVYTWDLLEQKLYVNGVLAGSNATANVSFINAWFAGAYLSTSTNYSFKGTVDEVAIYAKALTQNQVQQHYASGSGIVLTPDRAVGSQVTFQGVFETSAPPPPSQPDQELPTATPLPTGDLGGAVAANIALDSLRTSISAPSGWLKRALPTDVSGRNAVLLNGLSGYPAATSENWRQSLCDIIGIDKNTPSNQLVPSTAASIVTLGSPMWLRPGEFIYIVPDDQPMRAFADQDVTVSGWAANFNAIVTKLGGLPLPADARPHATPDRYAFFYQPGLDRSITIYDFHGTDQATTTLELTGSPSNGGFGVKFFYVDNALADPATYFTQAIIPYNATALQVKNAIDGSKTAAGSAFGTNGARAGSYYGSCVVTGGPLNAAPIQIAFPSLDPLQVVGMVVTDNYLNAGTVHFTYHNAGPYNVGRLCSIVTPSLDGHIATGVSTFAGGPYEDRFDNLGFRYMDARWGPTATGLDMWEFVPSWEEYQTALTNGTNLGHVIPMSIGNCAGFPFNHVAPAIRGDGTFTRTDGSMIVEGARIAFPPDVDLSGVIPEFLPIARTIRDYGVIPIDKTGGGTEIILRRPGYPSTGIPNVWLDILPLYRTAGDAPLRYMRSLPWHRAQIIDPSFSN